MPRTFSLQRLMLLITLLCVVTAFAVQFPDFANRSLAAACYAIPTAVVLYVVARHANRRWAVWVGGAMGATIGYTAIGYAALSQMGGPGWLDHYLSIAIPPAIVGLLFSAPFTIERVGP